MLRMTLIALAAMALWGCATLERALSPEVRYGQIYALEEALNGAASRCDDTEAVQLAAYWTSVTAVSLADHSRYLDEGSSAQQDAKSLLRQLGQLRVTPDESARCRQFAEVAAAVRQMRRSLTTADQ